jgi:hypothetical protein
LEHIAERGGVESADLASPIGGLALGANAVDLVDDEELRARREN